MAPQRLEKIESAPENGMGSEARTHNIWYTGARLTPGTLGPIQHLAELVVGLGCDR
jgi:hypothetical protein